MAVGTAWAKGQISVCSVSVLYGWTAGVPATHAGHNNECGPHYQKCASYVHDNIIPFT